MIVRIYLGWLSKEAVCEYSDSSYLTFSNQNCQAGLFDTLRAAESIIHFSIHFEAFSDLETSSSIEFTKVIFKTFENKHGIEYSAAFS